MRDKTTENTKIKITKSKKNEKIKSAIVITLGLIFGLFIGILVNIVIH